MADVPGIDTLAMVMIAGRQNYNIASKVVALDVAASDIEVGAAIRAAVSSDAVAQIPAGTPIDMPRCGGCERRSLAGERSQP